MMVQLVETPDKRLTGQFTVLWVSPDGKIRSANAGVSGAADGSSVAFSAQSSAWFSRSVSYSGTVNWASELQLTGPIANGQVTTLKLKRGTVSGFQELAAKVQNQSTIILKARADQQENARKLEQAKRFVAQMNEFVAGMTRFDSETDGYVKKFPAAEQRYRAITSKMRGYLARERALLSNPDAFVARSQIRVDILNGPLTTDQVHNDVSSVADSFRTKIMPAAQQIAPTLKACAGADANNTSGPPESRSEILSACRSLRMAYPEFKAKYDAMAAALTHVEATYHQEQTAQEEIKREAWSLN